MADEQKKPNMLLIGGALAAGAYMLLRYTAKSAAPTTTTTAFTGGDGSTTPTTTPTTASSLLTGGSVSAPTTAPLAAAFGTNIPTSVAAMLGLQTPTTAASSASPGRPGYALAGEDDIRFATAAGLANADGSGSFLTREWGDGSRNVRLNLARVIGQQYHIYVDDLVSALVFRWDQGGFGSWDEMYYSFSNDPGSLAAVLTAYNQKRPAAEIAPRW